jgi:hypothetical protein
VHEGRDAWWPLAYSIVAPATFVDSYRKHKENATIEEAISAWFESLMHATADRSDRALCHPELAPAGAPGMRITCPDCVRRVGDAPEKDGRLRTPVMVARTSSVTITFRVSAWHSRTTVRIPRASLPGPLITRIDAGEKKFWARANINAIRPEDLGFIDWE